MKQEFRHIFHFIIVAILSTLISNTVLAEIVFEDKIELEEKEIEEEEEQKSYFDSCSQNVENTSIVNGGKIKISTQLISFSTFKSIFTSIRPSYLSKNTLHFTFSHSIALYIRYCSLVVYS